MKRILVTGSEGFVGQHLVDSLTKQGHMVLAGKFDITCEKAVSEVFAQNEPFDFIFNLAGISSVGESKSKPFLAYKVNALGAGNVLSKAALKSEKTIFIYFSTAQVYDFTQIGRDVQIQTKIGDNSIPSKLTDEIDESFPVGPATVYGHSKLCGENLVQDIAQLNKNPLIILRLFNHVHKTQPPVFFLPSVYQQLLQVKKGEKEKIVLGNLDVLRDFAVVQDLVLKLGEIVSNQALLDQITSKSPSVINVGSGVSRNLREVVKELMTQMKVNCPIETDPLLLRKNEPFSVKSKNLKQFFKSSPVRSTRELVELFLKEY